MFPLDKFPVGKHAKTKKHAYRVAEHKGGAINHKSANIFKTNSKNQDETALSRLESIFGWNTSIIAWLENVKVTSIFEKTDT